VRDLAVACLLVSPTVQQAASRARVSYRQLREWLKHDADFKAAYQQARRQAVEHALGQLQAASTAAVAKLRRLLDSKDEGIVLRAAQAILGSTVAATDQLDTLERIEKLEQAASWKRATHGYHRTNGRP
jgi:hypothetical protein